MKIKYLIIGLLLPFALIAQQIAVKFYSEEPTNHPNRILNIPTNTPSDIKENVSIAPPGYVLFTLQEWEAYKDANKSIWRDWRQNVYEPYWATNSQPPSTVISNRNANLQALKDLVDTMQNAQNNWTNLTANQIQGLVGVHNQVLLRLRPLLHSLYQEHISKD